jgi:hypothetical protein
VTLTLAVTAEFLIDVAVITTLPTADVGAVYVVATPLVVVMGLNEPQLLFVFPEPGAQLQVTPLLVPVIVAVI